VYESLIYYNRSLVPLLQQTGMQVHFSEAPTAHKLGELARATHPACAKALAVLCTRGHSLWHGVRVRTMSQQQAPIVTLT
jgi:hypothetical protein